MSYLLAHNYATDKYEYLLDRDTITLDKTKAKRFKTPKEAKAYLSDFDYVGLNRRNNSFVALKTDNELLK